MFGLFSNNNAQSQLQCFHLSIMLNLARTPSPPLRGLSLKLQGTIDFFQSHGKVPLYIAQIYSLLKESIL